ncbi:hypothetical protein [Labedella endophytica]|uniref:Uncharacterized protein n=1 Tax=Labedella endophytica TaxID=1523160 RepID=A0A3S0Y2G7_9MICO|nr:hypothetical protein [Labedella endophytica]RUR03176.1 hypothetical protein ELQ94_01065 [Labedella endophytica]
MSEFTPRAVERKPGLGRSFTVVVYSWIVLTLATGIVASVSTTLAVDGPETPGRRLNALASVGYVVRGEYVVDDGALVWARWSLLVGIVALCSFLLYVIVVAVRAGLRADAARAASPDA